VTIRRTFRRESTNSAAFTTLPKRTAYIIGENTVKEITVDKMRRFLERRRIEYHAKLSSKGAEVLETKVVEEQKISLTNDLLGMKMKAHRGQSKFEQFIRETDQYQSRASTVHFNHIQISEKVRMHKVLLDKLNIRHMTRISALKISIPPLNNEIRDKDRLCLEMHVRARQSSGEVIPFGGNLQGK
jgi:hypothetical protein